MSRIPQLQAIPDTLSRADAAWLHMDEPTNHFVVTSLMLLEEPLKLERLREMLLRRLPTIPRMNQRIATPRLPLASLRWEVDPDFRLDAHLHRIALPVPGNRQALEDFIGDLAGQPMDLQRPPWQTYLVEDYEGGSAVVTRLHHCLGDGAAMVEMLLALADTRREGWHSYRPEPAPQPPASRSSVTSLASSLAGLITHPGRAGGMLRTAAWSAASLARISLLDADPPTPLHGAPTVLKRVAWSEPLELSAIRDVAHVTGTTINDILLSVVAGGLGSYLRERGPRSLGARAVRAMVPVNLRPRSGPVAPGNRFSLVLCELPIGIRQPIERLLRVRIEMDRIKRSPEAQVGWAVLTAFGLMPGAMERRAAGFFAEKSTLVLTNVIGPRERLYFAGSPIRGMTFWEPQSGGLGIGVSIYSYAGQVILGAISDAGLVANAAELTARFERSFRELGEAVG